MATLYWGPSGGTSTGTWSSASATNWFTDIGRTTPAAAAPTSTDDVVFDAASDNGTTFTVTIGTGAACQNLTVSALDFAMTFAHNNPLSVYGSLSFPSSNMVRSGFNPINFLATSAQTVNFNGYDLDNIITFNGVNGSWQLLSNLGANNASKSNLDITLTNGSLDLNGFIAYARSFLSNNSNTRSLAFGSSKIILYGNNRTLWSVQTATGFSYTGTPTVESNYTGATGTRNFFHGTSAGSTATNTPDFYVTGGTDALNFFNTRDLILTGFAGTLNGAGRTIYGNLTLSSGATIASNANDLVFGATDGAQKTITLAGKTIDQPVTFNGVNGSWQFGDNFSVAASRTVTLTNGTLNGNGKNVSIASFALGSGTKTLTLGSGTWTISGSGTAWNANTNVANLTVSASTGIISMTSASAKTFAGGAKSWPTLNQGGTGALTIQQSNTFANITNTVQPATITLTAGTTQTVSAFGVSGTSGNLITLNTSSAGSQATLSDSSGVNSVSFVSIKDTVATGGAAWEAFITNGNVDAGNNTGWDFLVQFGRYMYNVRKSKRILQQGVI